MNFLFFAAKNPLRSKLRTFFVIILLTVGVLCIFTSFTFSSFITSQIEELGGISSSDLSVYGDNLTQNDLNKIRNINNVKTATGVSTYILKVDNETLTLKGFTDKINDNYVVGVGHITPVSGVLIGDSGNEVLLTKEISQKLNKKVGDTIKINEIMAISASEMLTSPQAETINKEFKIRGIIDNINGIDGIIPLTTANTLTTNSTELNLGSIEVQAVPGEVENVKNELNQTYPDTIQASELPKLLEKIFFYITIFTVLVGGLIMMISTLKSIGERTREIGVLKAIGWSNKRVMGLILTESIVQLIIAWILSLTIITLLAWKIAPSLGTELWPFINNNINTISHIITISFIYSLLIPLVGCIMPLLRVVRLKHTEALKYE